MANTGGISAQVVNVKNNQPLVGAAVKLSGDVEQETKTGEDGKFKFADLPSAYNYVLDILADGFQPEHYEDIVVLDGITTNLYKLYAYPCD